MADIVALRLARQQERAAELESQALRLLAPLSESRTVLDSGCGAGAFALAVAPHVGEVIGIDPSPDLIAAARRLAPDNARFEEGDPTRLRFGVGFFDLAGCVRVLHHVARPELVVSELARVVRPGGRVLVVDQLAPTDPLQAIALDRFERARDPQHARLLSDADIRQQLEANDLVVLANEVTRETRDLEHYLDLAGVEDDARPAIRGLAPAPAFDVDVGWYVARTPGGRS
jgi:ubiquinone/menaquinone biosynthesis C-methylase UbiE